MAARQRDLHGPARAGSGNAIAVEQDRAGLDDVARIRIEQTGGRYRFHEREVSKLSRSPFGPKKTFGLRKNATISAPFGERAT